MEFYLKILPEQFKSLSNVFGSILISHEMVPFRVIDVMGINGNQFWRVIDNIKIENLETKEMLTFSVNILNIPYRSVNGYKIKGVYRQLIDLYEMSKGWHFEDKGFGNKDEPYAGRTVKFYPDTTLTKKGNFYLFEINNGIIVVTKGNKSVPLSVFMKALTGDSFIAILSKIGSVNKYLTATFVIEEPSRARCAEICNYLFSGADKRIKDFENYHAANENIPDVSRMLDIIQHFIGFNAMIGNGAGRMADMTSFRNIKNCILAKNINLKEKIIAKGTKLTPELLMELDYSEVNEISCRIQNSSKIFVFKKYDIYNFRGLNRGAKDTIAQFKAAENKGDTIYTLSNGEILKRSLPPICNTVNIIYNILNLYSNYLNGFSINSNIYDMTNQSVIGVEKDITNAVYERINLINNKVSEISQNSSGTFSVINLPLKLLSFDLDTLINKYASSVGKSIPLAAIENSLSVISQAATIVKDVSHAQTDMVSIQDTQIGRFDPFDAPENKNVGITHNRTFLSRVGNNSQLEAPFVQISNCKIVSDIIYLSAAEEKDQYIGEWNEDFSKPVTQARYNGIFVMVSPTKLNYLEASCWQHMSAARAMSPFAEAMAGKRAQMSSSQGKQAISIVGAERPIVNSGAESLICSVSDTISPYITADNILLEYCSVNDMDFEVIKGTEITYTGFEDDGTDRTHKFSFLINGISYGTSKKLPFYQQTLQKTIYGFVLNSQKGLKFRGPDIVLHSLTFDPIKYKRDNNINEGHLKFPDEIYDSGMALGINLHIGYMTYGSSTIDDAILLSDKLVTENNLSSVYVYQEEYEIEKMEGKTESFGYLDGRVPEGFGYNGLPLVGTYLIPGSVAIYKYTKKLNDDQNIDGSSIGYQTNVELPPTVGGEVVAVSCKKGLKATVTVVSLSEIEVGDKMAGRYGNKGVVAKIVPYYLMPFNPATGEPLDVILNPLGIPSRINVSQVLEVTLAACCRKENCITVVTPFQKNQLEKIKEKAKKCGIKPIRLMNPLTGLLTEYPVHVGEIYMYKLMHKVSGKIHSIGVTNEVDPTFKQPVGTGKSKAKGQAFGEMESWCLQSSKSYSLLEELQTILADDIESREEAQAQISDHPGMVDMDNTVFTNNNGKHLMVFFKSSGIKVYQNPDDSSLMSYEPLTDEDIQALNPANPVNINDAASSLRSKSIFNSNVFEKDDKWSWMPLGGEIVNPFWIERGNILKLIVLKKYHQTKYVDEVLRPIDVDNILEGKLFLIKHEDSNSAFWEISQSNSESAITGMKALTELFKEYDLSIAENYYISKQEKGKFYDSDISQIVASIREVTDKGGLKNFVISCFPVMPIRYRPTPIKASKQQDFDYYYTAIARCASSYIITQSNDDIVKAYEYLKAFMGLLGTKKKKALLSDKDNYVDLKTYFTVKQSAGRIRGMLGKKRVHRSGRSSIVPFDDITIPPTYIGIPYLIAINIYSLELHSLLEKVWQEPFKRCNTKKSREKLAAYILKNAVIGNESAIREVSKSDSRNQCVAIKEMIKSFVEGQIVIFGRQPSLHKFSIRAFKVKLVDGKAIQVHPLVCKGYNADFDGDTGYVIAPLTIRACTEAWDTLSVVASIVNPGNGKIIVEPSQDILLGCYYATSFSKNELYPSNISPIHYSSLDILILDLDVGLILPSTWVTLNVNGKQYISTAGRMVFNSLLPGGFTSKLYEDKYFLGISKKFYNLRYDYVISGRVSNPSLYISIGDIFKSLYDEYCNNMKDKERLIEYYQAISEFGFKWSERSGISFNIDDLKESSLIKDFLNSASQVSAEIDRKFSMGLMTSKDRRTAVMAIYGELRSKEFQKKFMSSFDRTNNIFMMFDSKARGSEDQIMQTCGLLGVLQKTKMDSLDVPITSNYATGLSSFELFQTSYAARLGLLSTIYETSKPGELTRTLVYEFSGLYVSNQSCGSNQEPLKIRYERLSDFMFLDNEKVSFKEIEDTLIVDEDALKFTKNFSVDNKLTYEAFEELKNAGLPWIDLDIGRVYFDTKFPDYLAKTLYLRTLNTRKYSDLIQKRYASKATIEQIEEERPRYIEAMLLLNCICKDGICVDSYGLSYDPIEPIKVGDFPGTEAAQAIGEPSAQLTLNLFHKGGKAGESIEDGITIIKSAIQSAKISMKNIALCAPINGYVQLTDTDIFIIGEDGLKVMTPLGLLETQILVKNGSYVTVGQPLTNGNIHPLNSFVFHTTMTAVGRSYYKVKLGQHSAIVNPSIELLTKIRYELAKFYYDTYYVNSIELLGRHFEVPAFMQTSHGMCIHSENPDFIEGRFYSVGALIQAKDIDFAVALQNAFDIITRNSGAITAACYQNAFAVLGNTVLKGGIFKERGPLGAILTGSSISEKGLNIKKLDDDINYSMLGKVKKSVITLKSKEIDSPIVFDLLDKTEEKNTSLDDLFDMGESDMESEKILEDLFRELEEAVSIPNIDKVEDKDVSKLDKF